MASDDDLIALLNDVRRRVKVGEGEAVLTEAKNGGAQAKFLLVASEARLRMGSPAEGKESAEAALASFKAQKSIRGQCLALQVLADCHLALEECVEVLELSVDAIELAWELGDKSAEANMMHTCAGAFHLQWRYPEATRAATRAANLYAEAGDRVGEAIALETAANASVSHDPSEDTASARRHATDAVLKEFTGPVGGQAAMDAARFNQTSTLYAQKPWQPISKFHPVLVRRPRVDRESDAPPVNFKDADGAPIFKPKKFSWRQPASKLDEAWYEMRLTAGDKIV